MSGSMPLPAALISEPQLEDFPRGFRLRMITAYPVIAEMTEEQVYSASESDLDAAFRRILNNRNLARTCRLYLIDHGGSDG